MLGTPLVIKIQDKKDEDKPLFPELGETIGGKITKCGILQGGMASGKPSFGFAIETKHGTVLAQLSYNHFDGVYRACQGAMERWAEEEKKG